MRATGGGGEANLRYSSTQLVLRVREMNGNPAQGRPPIRCPVVVEHDRRCAAVRLGAGCIG